MTSKKTIWMINQYESTPEVGSGGRHYYFAKVLSQLGYEVYLVAASFTHLLRTPKQIDQNIFIEEIQPNFHFVWIKMPPYSGAHSKNRILNWFNFAWKLTMLKEILPHPDAIMYSSPSLVGYLGAEKLAKDLNVPLTFEIRDIWPLTLCELGGYSQNHPFIKLLQWVEDRAYKNSTFVFSNLKNAFQHMQSRGMSLEKFTWIPNGFLKEEVEQAELLPEKTISQLPKNKFIIGYAGTFGVANALDFFLEAADLTKNNHNIHYVLVGSGKEKDSLIQKVHELNLINVTFIEPIPKAQVQSMLALFDVCYIGWRKSPLYKFGIAPNKLPEYLYSGRPVLHAFSGNGDPVRIADAGITVEAENPKAVADAAMEFYHMPEDERVKLGQNGRKFAVDSLAYENLSKKLVSILFNDEIA